MVKRDIQRILTTGVLAFLVASVTVSQGDSEGSFGEYLEVQLVNVELVVSDSKGDPILDLAAEEVRVFEDGQPVEITHFRPPGWTASVAGRADQPRSMRNAVSDADVSPDPIRMVIFVDNLNTGPASRTRLLEQLEEVLEEGLRPRDEVMVASFDGSLQILMKFSRDRKELHRTLEQANELVGDRLVASLRDRTALEDIQLDQVNNADGPCVFVGQIARHHSDNVNQRVQATLDALEQFVDSLAGVPGRKVLLHVSDGIPLVPGAEAWNHATTLCDGSGATEGVPGATVADQMDGTPNRFDPKTAYFDMMSYDTSQRWQRLAASASAHRVVFYPLYAPGLTGTASSQTDVVRTSMRNQADAVANKQDTLSILARETGGEATFTTNDFRPAVRSAIEEAQTSYELAYVSPRPGDGEVHSIRVEVERPGVRLRHRKSYEARSAQRRVRDGVFSTLFYGLEDNPLEASIDATVASDQIVNGRAKVNVRISLPLERLTLLPKSAHHSGAFTVFIAVRESSGRTSSIGHRTIHVDVPNEKFPVESENYEYTVGMEVGLETNTIAVALRDEVGGSTSYVTAEIDPAG